MHYLQKAKKYSNLPTKLLALVPEDNKEEAKELIARLVNAGIVCVPRACQSTVRLNIVKEVCKNVDVKLGLEERQGERFSYKVLTVNNVAEESYED